MKAYIKDPEAVLDYEFNWLPWLGTDTITNSSWAITPSGSGGILGSSESNTTTTARVFVEGGDVGDEYTLTNTIVTTGSRTDERSIKIRIQER